jgi:hypothetical protein
MNDQPLPVQTNPVLAFFAKRKFTALLAIIMSLNFLRMATVDDFADRFILDLLGAGLLIAATLSLCVEKRSRTIALTLGIPAIVLSLIRNAFSERVAQWILIGGRSSSVVFLGFIIAVTLRTLMTRPEEDSIAGAFCGYILIGVMFAEVFCLLEVLVPHSFQAGTGNMLNLDDSFQRQVMLEYFSFTTLTTLGFGDVVPVSPLARGLTIWEVVCGQFYLAVLVAGLINLRAARDTSVADA